MLRYSESQIREILAGVSCPAMLISGDQGYFHQYPELEFRKGYIKQLEHHVVQGGHHFHMEGDIVRTAGLINEFVKRSL
jgi:pimeloyl-ACP methyl ester carboxylesterase